jgi:hypothetical protein
VQLAHPRPTGDGIVKENVSAGTKPTAKALEVEPGALVRRIAVDEHERVLALRRSGLVRVSRLISTFAPSPKWIECVAQSTSLVGCAEFLLRIVGDQFPALRQRGGEQERRATTLTTISMTMPSPAAAASRHRCAASISDIAARPLVGRVTRQDERSNILEGRGGRRPRVTR